MSAVAAAAGLAIAATALVAGNAAGATTFPEPSDRVVVASELESSNGMLPSAPPDDTVADLQRILPDAETVRVRAAGEHTQWPDSHRAPVIADDALLAALDLGRDVRDALDDGHLVTVDVGASSVEFTAPDGSRHALVSAESEHSAAGIEVFVSPAVAEGLGVAPHDVGVALVSDRALTEEQIDDIDLLRSDWAFDHVGESANYLDVSVRWHDSGLEPGEIQLILTGIAVVFAVLVVGASLALAAAESREERDVLSVAGAGPNVLARAAAGRAWLLAAIGAAMAVPVGMLPVAVYAAADEHHTVFVVPWRPIGLLVVVLPAVVAVLALAISAAVQRLRPVRVATAMFG